MADKQDNTNVDVTAHPLYYTETYHRAKVDAGVYGINGGFGGAAVGAVAGATAIIPVMKKFGGQEFATGLKEASGLQKAGMRGIAGVGGAVIVGIATAVIGSAIGYIHGIKKGPRSQQLQGWTGKIEDNRAAQQTTDVTR